MNAQDEIEQLKRQVEQLQKALNDRQQLDQPKSLPALSRDQSFIEDMARFASGVLSEKQIRRKYHLFDESMWEKLGNDEALIEAIELERTRRIRSGATKRELAQNHIVSAPKILNDIMTDPKANAKHRIDSAKALDALADPGAQAADASERVIVTITLSADEKLTFGGSVKPDPNPIIDVTPTPVPGFEITEG